MKERTITTAEVKAMQENGITTFSKKDDSPRGCCTVSAADIKAGDKIVIDNYFTLVIEEEKTPEEKKLDALKNHLIESGDATPEELEAATVENTFNENFNTFEIIGNEYKVFTDGEADEAAKEEILASLWAFNADFILTHTEFWDTCTDREFNEAKKALQELQGRICESANALIKALICDLDEFVTDAIDSDGRGHFISWYDGEENESGDFFIYRTN